MSERLGPRRRRICGVRSRKLGRRCHALSAAEKGGLTAFFSGCKEASLHFPRRSNVGQRCRAPYQCEATEAPTEPRMISGVVFQGGKFKERLREREQLEAESLAEERASL